MSAEEKTTAEDVAKAARYMMELPLRCDKHEHAILDKMFRVANDMKNNLISWYRNQYQEMVRTKKWRDNQAAIRQLYRDHGERTPTDYVGGG